VPPFSDEPVDVVVARGAAEAVDRLEGGAIDAVLVDAGAVPDVPEFVATVESAAPATPTFVRLDGDGAASEVVARADDPGSTARLADAVAGIADADRGPDLDRSTAPASPGEPAIRDLPDDLARAVRTVRCRLVDATSPLAVERAVREELTAGGRFPFVWVGEYDRGERAVVPWLSDGDAVPWSLQRTFGVGDGEYPVLERAIRSRELRTCRYDAHDRGAAPFGDHAFDHGVRAVAIAPLATSDDCYGVVGVYARDPISEHERTAIREAAAAASHVLETIAVRGRLEQQERTLERYERLVETAGDGMYVLDEDGHFRTVNDAFVGMTGYSREGLLGEHVSLVLDRSDVDAGSEMIRSLLGDGDDTDTIELTLKTKAEDRIPCEAQIAVFDPEGEFQGSVGVLRDVTERKRRERKLHERNERLDAFTRIVSHDLRNPLSVAQGYLDLIEETGDLEYVDQTRDGLDRMEAIIDDVLAIARKGEWATDTDPVDLESVAREAWEYVSTDSATLTVVDSTTLDADRSRLLRLLENCFRNSVEHGGSAVTVRVGSLAGDRKHGFFVEDDGEGLPAEIRDRIFDPDVSSAEGLGIGLWVVREVATGHGWSVDATESEDGGARFEFETAAQFSD
jgi:PAS domain S-box-containing protein